MIPICLVCGQFLPPVLLIAYGKYVAVVGLEKFLDLQFEKAARCNIDYDKDGAPRKDTRYVSPVVVQI